MTTTNEMIRKFSNLRELPHPPGLIIYRSIIYTPTPIYVKNSLSKSDIFTFFCWFFVFSLSTFLTIYITSWTLRDRQIEKPNKIRSRPVKRERIGLSLCAGAGAIFRFFGDEVPLKKRKPKNSDLVACGIDGSTTIHPFYFLQG